MKTISPSFKKQAHNKNDKNFSEWQECDHTKAYPRSYTHLTNALEQIFEKIYIPATIAKMEKLHGSYLTAEQRNDMYREQAERNSFSYYSDNLWSPMLIQLRARDYRGCQLEYRDADEICKQIMTDFFDDLEECLAGVSGVKPNILNHTLTISGPAAFLRMIVALCHHNAHIPTSELYYESFVSNAHEQTLSERNATIETGESIIEVMREVADNPSDALLTAQQMINMPCQTHTPSHFAYLYEGETLIGLGPLFPLKDLIAIVEEELGFGVINHSKPSPVMN